MRHSCRLQRASLLALITISSLFATGCAAANRTDTPTPIYTNVPRELQKTMMPAYVIEPPDELLIQTVNNIRRRDDKLLPGDSLRILSNTTIPILPEDSEVTVSFKEIARAYLIENDGKVNLGPEYGKVEVAGMTIDEAQNAVLDHLNEIFINPPKLSVELEQLGGKQVVDGPHLVRMDGTVHLGVYGSVVVAGYTLEQAKMLLEEHLSQYILNPEVNVDVSGYNSKVYYIINDGGGEGDQLYSLPIKGNETVLDAFAQVGGLPTIGSKKKIWVARPAPAELDAEQILPVDWDAIVKGGSTRTNYQILPGDRIYVAADPMFASDIFIAKVIAPFERLFGFTILGNGAVRNIQQGTSFGGGGGGF
ncbi:Polysaccharide biosynthesis/export protein [Symmachiella dynata]|uniref:Polysaccharide biosynthesis/export protein n=2 Tax=Symmachiella dynata TaxID=2527995 RepID=A0A517ZJ50_9PLAN|nr:Polysaccharide biosynthesis/export protein [Symmachiella dynata]QDU42511.1 Polysaccharide biosynthesis/export protein [Symmachiella dynata]